MNYTELVWCVLESKGYTSRRATQLVARHKRFLRDADRGGMPFFKAADTIEQFINA